MDASAWPRILYLVGVGLLLNVNLQACTASQGDVWFSLNSTTYQNNSLVTLEDIGEGNDTSLLCMTNLTACCRRSDSGFVSGNWIFPNETQVPSSGKMWNFYRARGQMVIHMKRRRGGVEGIYRCEIPDSLNALQTMYIGVYNTNTGSPNVTSLTFDEQSRTLTCTSTGGPATTVTWRRDGVVVTLNATHQQTKRLVDPVNGTYQTVLTINSSVSQDDIVETYNCTVENTRGGSSETVVVPASIPTISTPPSDEATATSDEATATSDEATATPVIVVVAVVIVLVIIVVGVIIFVVLFRTKKKKKKSVMNKFKETTTDKKHNIKMKLKHERTTEIEASPYQPPYANIQAEAPQNVPSKSENLVNLNSPLTVGYSEIELEPDDNKQALPAKPPRHVTLSDPTPKATGPNPMYQNMNQHRDAPSTTDVSQGNDIYTVPDTTSSHTVDRDSSLYETVYCEPIKPSLFTDGVE